MVNLEKSDEKTLVPLSEIIEILVNLMMVE